MTTYYLIAADHPEIETILKSLHAEFRLHKANFAPVFSADRSEILVQVKSNMSVTLKTRLSQIAIAEQNDNANALVTEAWLQMAINPDTRETAEILEGRRPFTELVPTRVR